MARNNMVYFCGGPLAGGTADLAPVTITAQDLGPAPSPIPWQLRPPAGAIPAHPATPSVGSPFPLSPCPYLSASRFAVTGVTNPTVGSMVLTEPATARNVRSARFTAPKGAGHDGRLEGQQPEGVGHLRHLQWGRHSPCGAHAGRRR